MGCGLFPVFLLHGETLVEPRNTNYNPAVVFSGEEASSFGGVGVSEVTDATSDPSGIIVALPLMVSIGFIFLVKTPMANMKCCRGWRWVVASPWCS